MAEKKEQEQPSPAAQQPEQTREAQGRPCPKDCRKCSWMQQICCSSMMGFQMFDVMNGIIRRLDIQSQRMAALEERIAAIQSSEAELAAPEPVQGELFAAQEQ